MNIDEMLKEASAKVNTNETTESKPKKQPNKLPYIIAVSVASVMVIVLGILISLKVIGKNTIELNEKCIKVEVTGYEGYGTVKVTPGYDEIKKIAMEVFENKKDIDEASLDETFAKFYRSIEITTDKATDLYNGDKITIKLEVDEGILKDLGIKLTNTEYVHTVEGLGIAKEENPFDYFTFYKVEDADSFQIMYQYPEGCLGLSLDDFFVTTVRDENLNAEIKVEIKDFACNQAFKEGYVFTEIEHVIKEEDADGILLTGFDRISDSDLSNIKDMAEAKIQDLYGSNNDVNLDSLEYYGGWIAYASGLSGNSLELVYETKVSNKEGLAEPITSYIKVSFKNVVNIDGDTIVIGDNNLDNKLLYVDDNINMGYGKEKYDDYFMDILLSSSSMKLKFDPNGEISQY